MDNRRQGPWKLPLPEYTEHLYFKRFRKERPDVVLSIEEKIRLDEEKRACRRETKRLRQPAAETEQTRPSRPLTGEYA